VIASCGSDVDLGGGGDGGGRDGGGETSSLTEAGPVAIDAGEDAESDDCEPCTKSTECTTNTACVSLDGGNTYCIIRCDDASACESDETCITLMTTETTSARGCSPKSGACPVAPSPQAPDGSVLERCGDLVAPSVDAGCRACRYDCQKNGCYGGWWCNVTTKDCARPPKTCN
jgi:hypothetical protein